MNIEKRGKYPGVKVHLNPEEVGIITALNTLAGKIITFTPDVKEIKRVLKLLAKLAKMIKDLEEEEPALLAERTPEEIRATLEEERDKAIEKLAKMNAGLLWNDGKSKA